MAIAQEENFPRGGKKPVKRKLEEVPEKRIENLFSTGTNNVKRKKKERKPRDENKNALPDANSKMEVKTVDLLSYEKILDGTLVLGCIHSIHGMMIQVGLPGRIFGDMTVKHISQAYLSNVTKLIEENNIEELAKTDISKMFKVGQMLPVKVLLKEGNERGYKLYVSTDPKDVNSEYNHQNLEKGMLLWASIKEKSDHCYILDAGIANSRIVLPFTAVDENTEYIIGQPLWCSIRKCEVSKIAATLTVSAKEAEVLKAKVSDEITLSRLIPGMQVEFEVQKKLKNGLVGSILNNVVAHVNELYLKNPLDNLNKYNEDTILQARVLYIEPITKFVKLTLREINSDNSPTLKIGAIQTAKIIGSVGRGLAINLGKQCKGFVTYKRILNSLAKKETSDMAEMIEKKYPAGSNHQCRILCYNYMEMEYICTFETNIIKETVFSEQDLQYGEIMQGKITKIQDDGIEIRVGNVTGFIPNLHICNTQFSRNIKNKFKVGQTVKTKLFEKAKNSNRFTLKQALLESDICLSKYEDAKVNRQYPGVIIKKMKSGALVLFYGGVKGFLPCKKNDETIIDMNMFFEGQVILFTIVRKEKDNRITLSLDPPEEGADKKSKKKKNKKKNSNEEIENTKDDAKEEPKSKKDKKVKEDTKQTDGKVEITMEVDDESDEEDSDEEPVEEDDESMEEDDESIEEEDEDDNESVEEDDTNEADDSAEMESEDDGEVSIKPIKMPGMQEFFNLQEDESEEEEKPEEHDEKKEKPVKKQKLKPEEVRKKLLEDEERLLQTEIKLAGEQTLQTPKEIEKALVSDPHNSKLWVMYIATLTSAGEIDKARGASKKALETIPFEKVSERFNLWVAYLNLENSYGNNESFDEVFAEAINRNDSYKIHMVAMEILRESKKYDKMEEIISMTRKKFKQNPEIYLKIAKTYYLCGKFHNARQMQGIAVKYVTKKKEQVDLLVQFAILEFKHGDVDYAESVFETILQTDPTRVDVWCTYADQLITKQKYDFARKIFTRAANTKLPLKKTKVILSKFHKFEKDHGNAKTLEEFKKFCTKFAENL